MRLERQPGQRLDGLLRPLKSRRWSPRISATLAGVVGACLAAASACGGQTAADGGAGDAAGAADDGADAGWSETGSEGDDGSGPSGDATAEGDGAPNALDAGSDVVEGADAPNDAAQDASGWEQTASDGGALSEYDTDGVAFDGRYMYFANPPVVRFDTTSPFGSDASWSRFDVQGQLDPNFSPAGALFDGRYVYLVGRFSSSDRGIVVRFDTTMPFGSAASWQKFDVTTVNGADAGFCGAVFDGKYVYLVPYQNANGVSGRTVRYDVSSPFTATTSWSDFDLTTVQPRAAGYCGGIFDGRYIYYVPKLAAGDAGLAANGLVARYDTTQPFAAAASWAAFDLTSVDPRAAFFQSGAFDGRYVYFVPTSEADAPYGRTIARLDTQAAFSDPGSWSTFTVGGLTSGAGFGGAAFDGRRLFFPAWNPAPAQDGPVVIFDTTAPFATAASWSAVDTAAMGLGGNLGTPGFDGRYIYFSAPQVVRFDTQRQPPGLPAGYSGSFF